MNLGVTAIWFNVRIFFGYIPRSGIAGSYNSSIFNFLRKFCTVFHSGCSNLKKTYQHHSGFPFLHIHTNICCLDNDHYKKWYLFFLAGTLSEIQLELKSHLVKCLRVLVFITSKKLTCRSKLFAVGSEKPCVKAHGTGPPSRCAWKGLLPRTHWQLLTYQRKGSK